MGADQELPGNYFRRFCEAVGSVIDSPVTWVRENVVVPNRPTYYWYHRQFKRVPTIDECYRDDIVCYFEANEQYKRDKKVDEEIVSILRRRFEECVFYESPDHHRKCQDIKDQYDLTAENYFTKYGDLGVFGDVLDCYMKQKHRMIWERRHGPVGSGMKPREEWGKE